MIPKESVFICPVCKGKLFMLENTLRCMKGHTFDRAKQGYVNLLMKNSSRRHGDDRLMVISRRNFLDKGYYSPLRDAVSEILGKGHTVLDSGCGEGYYTSHFARDNRVCAIDISKDAVALAAGRYKNIDFAVASISDIPLCDGAVDAVINIFAPDSPDEFLRVLKPGGRLVSVTPGEGHLMELKTAVYDNPYLNPLPVTARDGYTVKDIKTVNYRITLNSNEDIISLFKMTPYYYKTSATDQEKLEKLKTLTTRLEFVIAEYEKI